MLNQKFNVTLPLYVVHDIDSCTGVYLKIWSTLQDPNYANYVVKADLWTNKDGKKFNCDLQDVGIYSTKRMAEELMSPGVIGTFGAACTTATLMCEAPLGLLEGPGVLWGIAGDTAGCFVTPIVAGYTLKSNVTRMGTFFEGLGISLGTSLVKNKRIYKSPKWDFINNQRRDLIYRATRGTVEYKQSIGKMNEYLVKAAKERVAEQLSKKLALQDLVTNPKDLEFVLGESTMRQYIEQALKRQPPEKVLQMIVENTKLPTNLEELGTTGKIPTKALRDYIYQATRSPSLANILPESKAVDETTAKILLHAAKDKEFEKVVLRASSESKSTGKIFDQIAKMATKKPEIAETLIKDATDTIPPDKAFSTLEKLGADSQGILKTIVKENYWKITKGTTQNPEIHSRFQIIEKQIRKSPEFEKMVNERLVQEAGGDSPEAIINWLKSTGDDTVIREAFASSGLLDNMKKEVALLNQLKEKGVISDREYEKTIARMLFGSAGASDDELIARLRSLGISVDKGINPDKFIDDITRLVRNGTLDPADLANGSKYVDDLLRAKLGIVGKFMRMNVINGHERLTNLYEFGKEHPMAMAMFCGAAGQAVGTLEMFKAGQIHGFGGLNTGVDRYIEVGGDLKDGIWIKVKAGDAGTWTVQVMGAKVPVQGSTEKTAVAEEASGFTPHTG